jgi:hypothetical protein
MVTEMKGKSFERTANVSNHLKMSKKNSFLRSMQPDSLNHAGNPALPQSMLNRRIVDVEPRFGLAPEATMRLSVDVQVTLFAAIIFTCVTLTALFA